MGSEVWGLSGVCSVHVTTTLGGTARGLRCLDTCSTSPHARFLCAVGRRRELSAPSRVFHTLPPPSAPRCTHRIDVFAVRQWPGNGADLDFRGVLRGCTAAVVVAPPIEGTLLKEHGDESMFNPTAKEAFLKSDEYKAVAKVLPFCRLWYVLFLGAGV